MHLFFFYKHRPEKTGFNIYAENTQQLRLIILRFIILKIIDFLQSYYFYPDYQII